MLFSPKTIILYSREKAGFDSKNNHKCRKLTNFKLDVINKIDFRMLAVNLYLLYRF